MALPSSGDETDHPDHHMVEYFDLAVRYRDLFSGYTLGFALWLLLSVFLF